MFWGEKMLSKKWKFLCEHYVIEKIKLKTITWQNKDKWCSKL